MKTLGKFGVLAIVAFTIASSLPMASAGASRSGDLPHAGQRISTTHQGAHVGWQTPRTPSSSSIANSSDANGATSIITLNDAQAPHSFSFAVDVPTGFGLAVADDGGVVVAKETTGVSYVLGRLDPPWARDASGKALRTTFSVSGNTLTQTVGVSGARFPVTADPHYTWGWVTGTAYFNRSETRSAKTSSTAWGIAAGLCAAFGPETLGIACAVSAAAAGQWSYVASNAYGDGKCLAIVVPTMLAHSYSGNWCK